jgi:hypothetical protein
MRETMGQPLMNISSTVLNKVVSRDLQFELRKYKMDAQGKNRKRSASRGREASPTVRFEDKGDVSENKAVRNILQQLDAGVNDKLQLLKMLVIRGDEADQKFKRLRAAFANGEVEMVDRITNELQAMNGTTMADVQNETEDGPNLIQMIGQLS